MPDSRRDDLGRRLAGYSAAAGAALSVSAPGAEAAPVYTPTLVTLGLGQSLDIDLDGNGVDDVQLNVSGLVLFTSTTGTSAGTFYSTRAAVAVGEAFGIGLSPANRFATNYYSALRLASGSLVDAALFAANGSNTAGSFAGLSYYYYYLFSSTPGGATDYTTSYSTYSYGQFLGERGFAALRFDIDGAEHFAWLDLEASEFADELTLRGWAYESEAGEGLRTFIPEPSSLALLASGVAGLCAWRRGRKQKETG